MAHGTTLHQQVLTYFVVIVVQLRSWYATSNVDLEVASLSGSSTKLLKSGDSDVNRKIPEVVILQDHSALSESSSDSKDVPRKEKCVFGTKERPPYALIEVASQSTRTNDLIYKWIQYAVTGIRLYYIVDLSYYERSGEACVIVGSLEPFDGAVKCYHGSPNPPAPLWKPPDVMKNLIYYKKVCLGGERVGAGILKDVRLTSAQCMDPVHRKGIFKALKHGVDMPLAKKSNGRRSTGRSGPVLHETSSSRALKDEEKHSKSGKERSSTATSKASSLTTSSSSPSHSPPCSPDRKRSRRDC